ncbi:hypothetical protein NMY22_g16351 [Coprinellus aureogranulatus]|nr:hypothetical protein NMY22_g16351 [Coprinellus aureogranulatus]
MRSTCGGNVANPEADKKLREAAKLGKVKLLNEQELFGLFQMLDIKTETTSEADGDEFVPSSKGKPAPHWRRVAGDQDLTLYDIDGDQEAYLPWMCVSVQAAHGPVSFHLTIDKEN